MPTAATGAMQTTIGSPTASAIFFFFIIVALTLYVTYWAAKKTKSASEFYAAGRTVTAIQNGFALSGDYMSAASFLGIAGLVSLKGYDGMIYATGWLVGWPALMFLIAEPLAQPRQVHLRRRRLLPPPPEARAYRLRHRRHPHGALLHHRPDGGRRQPDQAHVRHPLRTRRDHRRQRHAGVRALRRHARDHLGADHQGRACS